MDIKFQKHETQKNLEILENKAKKPEEISGKLENKTYFEEILKQDEDNSDKNKIIEYGKKVELDFNKLKKGEKIWVTVDALDFYLEVAQTKETQEKGLMNREKLEANGGMIFVFSNVGLYPFWMKNTLIPLDIIWVDENKKIIDFMVAEPCEKNPCKIYKPAGKAKYVIELLAGNFSGEIGDFVSF